MPLRTPEAYPVAGWSSLRAFVERYYVERLADPCDPQLEARLVQAESRLGRVLPTALVDWYRFVGGRLCTPSARGAEPLVQVEDLIVADRLVRLSGDWLVGFNARTPAGDPPVFVLSDQVEAARDADTRRQLAPRLSSFLTTVVEFQTALCLAQGSALGPLGALAPQARGLDYSVDRLDGELPLADVIQLRSEFEVEAGNAIRVYTHRDALLVMRFELEGDHEELVQLSLAAPSKASLDRLVKEIQTEGDAIASAWETEQLARRQRVASAGQRLAGGRPDPRILSELSTLQDRFRILDRVRFNDLRMALDHRGSFSDGQRVMAAQLLESLLSRTR